MDTSRGEIILIWDWNIEALEVNKCMVTKGLANKIYNIHGYLDAPITYQLSKDCPVDDIYCSDHLAANQGVSYHLED